MPFLTPSEIDTACDQLTQALDGVIRVRNCAHETTQDIGCGLVVCLRCDAEFSPSEREAEDLRAYFGDLKYHAAAEDAA